MSLGDSVLPADRARVGWWLFVLALSLAAAYVAYSFIGMLVLGFFGYYATRPICRRLERLFDHKGIAAGTTVLIIVVPILALVAYTVFTVYKQVRNAIGGESPTSLVESLGLGALPAAQQQTLNTLLRNPQQAIDQPGTLAEPVLSLGMQAFSAVTGGLVLVGLALTLSYFLLARDGGLSNGFRRIVGGEGSVAYAYAAAVDEDLESVFFGNLVFVLVMAVIAAIAYEATNLLAPGGLHVPLVFVLAVLTGVASLIPLVVSKIIYLPIVAYLAFQALGGQRSSLLFVAGVLVVYFLVLDILPQTFIQPYVTGRQLDMLVLMFGYILGPILFGWYGFFLLPIFFVLVIELLRIVLPELVGGETLTGAVTLGESVGTNPGSAREEIETGGEGPTDDAAETD